MKSFVFVPLYVIAVIVAFFFVAVVLQLVGLPTMIAVGLTQTLIGLVVSVDLIRRVINRRHR